MTDIARLHDLQTIDTYWEKMRRRLLQLQKLLAEPAEVVAARAALVETDASLHGWHGKQTDADLAVHTLDEQRLRVRDGAFTRRRVPRVTDGDVPRQRGQRGLREDLGQVFGALLTIDGNLSRRSNGKSEAPVREETGRHELIGGISVEVPEDTARRALTTWAVLRGIWYVLVTLVGGAGWLLHLWRK